MDTVDYFAGVPAIALLSRSGIPSVPAASEPMSSMPVLRCHDDDEDFGLDGGRSPVGFRNRIF